MPALFTVWMVVCTASPPINALHEGRLGRWISPLAHHELRLHRKVWDGYLGPRRLRASGHRLALNVRVAQTLTLNLDSVQWVSGNTTGQYLDLDLRLTVGRQVTLALDNRFAHTDHNWGSTSVVALSFSPQTWLRVTSSMAFVNWSEDTAQRNTFSQSLTVRHKGLRMDLALQCPVTTDDLGLSSSVSQTLGPVRLGFSASYTQSSKMLVLCTLDLRH